MRIRLAQLRIALEGDARPVAVAGCLLEQAEPDREQGSPDLLVTLREASPVPRPPGPRQFYSGVLDVHVDGDELLLSDGASRFHIPSGGRSLAMDVADASLEDEYAFAHSSFVGTLALALRWHGRFHVHAGALVSPRGSGILVAGHSGAGKSTLTLALLEAGCAYLGDDALLLEACREGDRIHAFPRLFHVAERTARAFPRIEPLLGSQLPAGDKRFLDPSVAWPGRQRPSMDAPSILLFPHVTGEAATVVEPFDSAEALGRLVESSTFVVVDGLPGGEEHLAALTRIADEASAFAVHLGKDLLARPAEVAGAFSAQRRERPDDRVWRQPRAPLRPRGDPLARRRAPGLA